MAVVLVMVAVLTVVPLLQLIRLQRPATAQVPTPIHTRPQRPLTPRTLTKPLGQPIQLPIPTPTNLPLHPTRTIRQLHMAKTKQLRPTAKITPTRMDKQIHTDKTKQPTVRPPLMGKLTHMANLVTLTANRTNMEQAQTHMGRLTLMDKQIRMVRIGQVMEIPQTQDTANRSMAMEAQTLMVKTQATIILMARVQRVNTGVGIKSLTLEVEVPHLHQKTRTTTTISTRVGAGLMEKRVANHYQKKEIRTTTLGNRLDTFHTI